jgi:hypothetical protein
MPLTGLGLKKFSIDNQSSSIRLFHFYGANTKYILLPFNLSPTPQIIKRLSILMRAGKKKKLAR